MISLILRTDVDVPAGAAALFFNFSEIGALVPVRFGIVVVGEGIEPGGFSGAAGDDSVSHADDGGGVPAATELGEDGPIGTKFALDGFRENGAEVLLVFGVGAVTDFLFRIEIPILADGVLSWSEEHGRGRRDGMDADAGCQMHGRKHREPAGDVLFVECEGFASKPDEWIKDGAPGGLVCVD